MPKNRQIIPPKQSSTAVPPPHSYTVMQFRSIQNEDDDDICPVCESECTCGNNNAQSTPQPAAPLPSPPSTAPTPVPLKIKLPARSALGVIPKLSTAKRGPPKSNSPKLTTADSAIVGGTGSNNYLIVHRSGPFSTPGHQLGTPMPPATASTSLSFRDTSPLTPEPELEPPSKANSRKKRSSGTLVPKNKKKAAPTTKAKQKAVPATSHKKILTGTRSKKNKDAAWTTTTSRRQSKRPMRMSSDESADNLTDEDEYVTRMAMDSDGTESVQFPTFISAISTTSDNDDSISTMTDSFDSDSSIRAEEENLILAEQRAKVTREILNGEESWHMEKRKWDHLRNNNNWEIRPRKRSVGSEEADSDTNSESDSEMEEEEEEEGDGDEDPDIRYGHGMVTGWQSDDDDFDAELFFATLTDSSGPGSDADAEDGEDSGDEHSDNSDLSSISMTEAAAAGLLSSSSFGAGCPLVVTEDWDGKLVFANGVKEGQGVLDVHFEVDAAQRHRNIHEAMEVDVQDTEGTMERNEDEDEEDFISEDGGETTDDMLDHRSGISTPQGVPLLFRCPTPPVASIDPSSTFSPIIGSRRRRIIRGALDSPKPADILASAGKMVWDSGLGDSNIIRSPASIAAASPPGTATSSSNSRQMPSMGSFSQVSADPKRRAIIDGTKVVVFSPFTRARRAQRRSGRGRKRSAAGLDTFPYNSKRPRQSSLPGSSRTPLPVDTEEEGDPLVQSSPELPLATSIDLDDVLDASFLDSDDSGEPAANTSGERHLRNLNRWDRVPMGTFRRSRTAHTEGINIRVSRLAPPNDGVSYGSAGGHVLRRSPFGTALWQTSDGKVTSKHVPGSVTVSPVIFPVRDGERTPTADQYPDPLQNPEPSNPGPSTSRKLKRKEKNTRTRSPRNTLSSIPTSSGFHHPLPTVPSLNL